MIKTKEYLIRHGTYNTECTKCGNTLNLHNDLSQVCPKCGAVTCYRCDCNCQTNQNNNK